jgi:hypothetical protein
MSSWNTLELASAARRQQHQREHRDRRRQRPRHRPSTLPAALRAGAWPAGVEVVVGAAKIERFGSPGRSAPEDRRRDVENVAAPAVRAVRAEGHLPKRGPPLENGPPPIRGEGPLSESTAGGLGTTSTRGAIPRGRGPRGVRAQWSERLAGEVPTRRSLSNSFAMKPKKASASTPNAAMSQPFELRSRALRRSGGRAERRARAHGRVRVARCRLRRACG